MSLDLDRLTRAVARHGRIARVVVAETKGSGPCDVGTEMLVWESAPNGEAGLDGSIGGGALEYHAIEQAMNALWENLDRRDFYALGPTLGQCCGGAQTLVTEIFDADRLSELTGPIFLRRVDDKEPGVPPTLQPLADAALRHGTVPPTWMSEGWLIEPIHKPDRQVWIFGAGHVGRAIVDVLAPLPQVSITWVDTAANRFPDPVPDGVRPFVAQTPGDAVAHAPADAEHLIMTYSHKFDLDICHRLLGHHFRSVGLIGSETKWARFRSRLRMLGHSDAQISRIRCPIGQKQLGKHPQAIAVGVAADLLSQTVSGAARRGAQA